MSKVRPVQPPRARTAQTRCRSALAREGAGTSAAVIQCGTGFNREDGIVDSAKLTVRIKSPSRLKPVPQKPRSRHALRRVVVATRVCLTRRHSRATALLQVVLAWLEVGVARPTCLLDAGLARYRLRPADMITVGAGLLANPAACNPCVGTDGTYCADPV
jgi:hypothetical protein